MLYHEGSFVESKTSRQFLAIALFGFLVLVFMPIEYFSVYLPNLQNAYGYKLPLSFAYGFSVFLIGRLALPYKSLKFKLEPIDSLFLSSIVVVAIFESLSYFNGSPALFEILYRLFFVYGNLLLIFYWMTYFKLKRSFFTKSFMLIGATLATIDLLLYSLMPEAQYPAFKVFEEAPLGLINLVSYICSFICGLVILSRTSQVSIGAKIMLISPNLVLIIANQSRGALLAFFVPIIAIAFFRFNKGLKTGFIALSLATALFFHKSILAKLSSFLGADLYSLITQNYSGPVTGEFISSSRRALLSVNAIQSFVENFPLGTTLGNIDYIHFFNGAEYEKNMVHSFALLLLSGYGLGGLFILTCFALLYFKLVRNNPNSSIIHFCFINLAIIFTFEAFIPIWACISFATIALYSEKQAPLDFV